MKKAQMSDKEAIKSAVKYILKFSPPDGWIELVNGYSFYISGPRYITIKLVGPNGYKVELQSNYDNIELEYSGDNFAEVNVAKIVAGFKRAASVSLHNEAEKKRKEKLVELKNKKVEIANQIKVLEGKNDN